MTDSNNNADATTRRPYEAPKVEETASFETLALQCSKGGVPGGECDDNGEPGAGAS